MINQNKDTITAIATPPGTGGVGIIRVSGEMVKQVSEALIGHLPVPRLATFARFRDNHKQVVDEGLVLYFPKPNSFTGEDILELQGHGGPVVMDMLLKTVLDCGVRMASPGEFSQRAFLNNKIDLAQAEAISDLIESTTSTAARLALKSLDGEFSQKIHQLVDEMTHLRIYVEAAIDFPEEEIDFLSDGKVEKDLYNILETTEKIEKSAVRGRLVRDGMTLVLAGKPNAGKSSLMNALAGFESAIVTDIPGTTRDVLRESIQIDGMPLHLIDTAGLRDSHNAIEQEGIRRAKHEMEKADRILWIIDSQDDWNIDAFRHTHKLPDHIPMTIVLNKTDLSGIKDSLNKEKGHTIVCLSAKYGNGLEILRQHLKQCMGYNSDEEGEFIARRRHIEAIQRAKESLIAAQDALVNHHAGELVAEDLRYAQTSLSEITGEFSADDLLGEIFSSFCIGK